MYISYFLIHLKGIVHCVEKKKNMKKKKKKKALAMDIVKLCYVIL